MDDVTIHIDELVLDGPAPPDLTALGAALRGQVGLDEAPQVAEAVRGAVARALPLAGAAERPASPRWR